jgi:hypothetical protein
MGSICICPRQVFAFRAAVGPAGQARIAAQGGGRPDVGIDAVRTQNNAGKQSFAMIGRNYMA